MAATGGSLAGHGGRLCVAQALYPHAPGPWIDLSTGINPEPYPDVRASTLARSRLPTPSETRGLEMAAGRAFDVDDAERVAATGGSEAALRLMPYALRVETAVVVGPTYSSHAAAWRGAGANVSESGAADAPMSGGVAGRVTGVGGGMATVGLADVEIGVAVGLAAVEVGVAVGGLAGGSGRPYPAALASVACGSAMSPRVVTLVNPNNPDGAVVHRERLLRLHDNISSRGGYLVVDEAFAEVEPACSVAALAGVARYPRLIVLRSFGKFYGLSGVRLGFVIAAPPIIARFRELLGDWPVSADAIAVGLAAYADGEWAERTRERLQRSANRLDDVLISSGLEIVGGTSLFRLVRSDDARERFENLLRAGILARPFDHDPTLLRFGLPHEQGAWQRLVEALRKP